MEIEAVEEVHYRVYKHQHSSQRTAKKEVKRPLESESALRIEDRKEPGKTKHEVACKHLGSALSMYICADLAQNRIL